MIKIDMTTESLEGVNRDVRKTPRGRIIVTEGRALSSIPKT